MTKNDKGLITYARLYGLLMATVTGQSAKFADAMEAAFLVAAEEEGPGGFFVRTIPMWRAVNKLAWARANLQVARSEVDRISHLMKDVKTMQDVKAAQDAFEAAFT